MGANSVINEFKFSRFQAVFSCITPLALYEPFSKMTRQALMFHEYYWFIVMFICVQFVYRLFLRPTLLLMSGTPAITLTKSYITVSQQGYSIEWKDIQEMDLHITQGKGRSCSMDLTLKDPWKYISQIRNPFMRYYRWYLLDYYNPFSVNLSIIEGDSNEIYDQVENCFHQYRRVEIGA